MAINVQHSPPKAAIAGPAYQQGLGEWQRFMMEQRLRQQAMEQQERMQAKSIQANLYSQDAARRAGAQENALQRQFALGEMGVKRDWQLRDQAGDREFILKRDKAGDEADMARARLAAEQNERDNQARLDQDFARQQFSARQNQAKMEMDWVLGGLKSGELKYSPSQRKRMAELEHNIHSVNIADNLEPDVKSETLAALEDQLDSLRRRPMPVAPDEMPATMQEKAESGRFREAVKAEDGSFMGFMEYTEVHRNGHSQLSPKFIPHKPGESPALKEQEAIDKFSDLFIGKTKPAGDGQTPRPYTDDDIAQAWKTKQSAIAKMRSGAVTQSTAIPQEFQPVIDRMRDMGIPKAEAEAQIRAFMQGQQGMPPPEQVQGAPEPAAPEVPNISEDLLAQDEIPVTKENVLKYAADMLANKNLPRVFNDADFDQLPRGAYFIDKHGNKRGPKP